MFIRSINAMVARSREIIVLTACLAGATACFTSVTKPVERALERQRDQVMSKAVSGDIVVVAIDDASLKEVHAWPWPRSIHGRLAERLKEDGAKRIVYDVDFSSPAADPAQDAMFAKSLDRAGNDVVLTAYSDATGSKIVESTPGRPLSDHSRVASAWIKVDTDTGEFSVPYSQTIKGVERASIATVLAGRTDLKTSGGAFPLDWSFRYADVPTYSYADVLAKRIPRGALAGKTIVVGATAKILGDHWTTPEGPRIAGVLLHVLGAETLMEGAPVPVGPYGGLLVSGLLVAFALRFRSGIVSYGLMFTGLVTIVAASWYARSNMSLVVEIMPAVIVLITGIMTKAVAQMARATLLHVTTDEATNLPNLTAMLIEAPAGPSTIAVRMRNHLETASILGQDAQSEILRRARDRIRVAAGDNTIYLVDEHSFAWRTTTTGEDLSDTLEGLVALFSTGIQINGKIVDAPVSAGIVENGEMDIHSAVTNALLSADHASRQGLPWTRHTDSEGDDEWRLTMMGELDQALDNGNVWVAYQAKHDVHSGRISGAEALVRWTHPQRGPIRPDQFIPILEEAGRIDKLTSFVLEHAIRDFAALGGLGIAVNLSTRVLGTGRIVEQVDQLLRQYGLDPNLLTLEITESAALSGTEGITELKTLREMGVKISIDDYGTGQSTLNYLRQLPATELKVDQSFVRVVNTSQSDKVMIASTIGLAHELGLTVVAEGVETADVLKTLEDLDCDIIQGYFIGKPVALGDFVRSIATDIVMPKIVRVR